MIQMVAPGGNIDRFAALRQARFARFPEASFFGPEHAVRYIGEIIFAVWSRDS